MDAVVLRWPQQKRGRVRTRCAATALALGLLGMSAFAAAQDSPDALLDRVVERINSRTGHTVHDFAQVLTDEERRSIEGRAAELERKGLASVVVVIVPSLQGGEIGDFSIQLTERIHRPDRPDKPGIGHKGRDDGILVLVAMKERNARIEVGYGLEPILPDFLAGRILDQRLVPAFKQKRYGAGIQGVVEEIGQVVERGEPAKRAQGDPRVAVILFLALFVGVGALVAGFALGMPQKAAGRMGPFWFGSLFVGFGLGIGCMVALLLALAIHIPVAALAGFIGWNLGRSPTFRGGKRSSDWSNWDWGSSNNPWGSGSGWSTGGSNWGGGGFSSGSWSGYDGGRFGGGGATVGW